MIRFLVPIAIYTVLSLFFLLFSREAKGLKCVLVASYCGVIIISFTRGTQGAIWLAPLFLFLVGSVVVWRRPGYAFGSRTMVRFTYTMFLVFVAGVAVGLLRYDPELEFFKAGAFRTLLKIPIQYLMVLYHLYAIAFLALAFILPLRYYIDRKLFLQLLTLCWFFSTVLAVLGFLHYTRIADFAFSYGRLPTYETSFSVLLGFRRAAHGQMLIGGIFMSFAMTQLTRSYNLKILGYISMPILIIALLFSHSRAALVGILVGGASLAVTLGGVRALKGILISLLGLTVICTVLARSPELHERFLSFVGPAGRTLADFSAGRIVGWLRLVQVLVGNPGILAFGTGFQNFDYFFSINLEIGKLGLAAGHNNWLHIVTEFGLVGFIVFNGWLVAIFYWLVSWRRMMTDSVDRMMPGIFVSLMLTMVACCLTQESLAPSASMIPWMVHFFILLGIWVSYYRTQMGDLYAMWETEYEDYVPADSIVETY